MSEDEKKAKQSKKAKTSGTVGLFDPMTLRGVTVRNRIWLPPMPSKSDVRHCVIRTGRCVPQPSLIFQPKMRPISRNTCEARINGADRLDYRQINIR